MPGGNKSNFKNDKGVNNGEKRTKIPWRIIPYKLFDLLAAREMEKMFFI